MRPILLDGYRLTFRDFAAIARRGSWVGLTPEAEGRVKASRALVEDLVAKGRVVYGVTTGFGKFSDVFISPERSGLLQRNLLVSHAAGVGTPLSEETVRAVMALRVNALAKGYSGIRPETLRLLIEMLNRGVHPVIPEQGSLGASGDLAPLAHMALVMIGGGEAFLRGRRLPGGQALSEAGLDPVELGAKEGLALINGTQVMTGIGGLAITDAENMLKAADIVAALTTEALGGIPAAFDPRVQAVRGQPGQSLVARNLLRLLEGSALVTRPGEARVQDAYALRCIPQVHGASVQALGHVFEVVGRELNAATDNPLIFPDDGDVISGGNFHGQPVALVMDYLGISLAEMGNISERRTERLVNPALSGLPAFLTPHGGLHSGLMIAQYTAASLVSENKVLAHPASVDSIPSSANQEDHVSMGTIAARKARSILTNVRRTLAIELMAAAQAVDFSDPRGLGKGSRAGYRLVRERVPRLEEDRFLAPEIEALDEMISSGALVAGVEEAVGPLEGIFG